MGRVALIPNIYREPGVSTRPLLPLTGNRNTKKLKV
jgi:hypothetical protein